MSVIADDKDDVCSKDVKLALSTVDSSVSQRWTTPAAVATITPHDDNDDDEHHHDCSEKTTGVWQHGSSQRAPPLYGRPTGTEFETSYDYSSYSPQYSSRYASFQGPSASSYVGPVTPYAGPYSPSGLGAYTFNFAGPCAAGAPYNASYVPHHLTAPSAALLTPDRSAPSYRFAASSTSLLQSRTYVDYTD